ncbi:MAG: ABC transporter permease [Brevinematia bacterium]
MKKKENWKHNFFKVKKYLEVIKVSFLSSLAYKGDILISLLNLFVFLLIFCFLWKAVFSSGKIKIENFTSTKMIWYYTLIFPLEFSASKFRRKASALIHSGDIANFLTKPFSYPLFLLFDSLGSSVFNFIACFPLALLITFGFTMKVVFTVEGLLSYSILGFLGLILDTLIAISINLLAFWVEDVKPILFVYIDLLYILGGQAVPLDVMPKIVQKISLYTPLRFSFYSPAISCINFTLEFFLQALVGTLISIFAILLIISLEFFIGSRRLSINGG